MAEKIMSGNMRLTLEGDKIYHATDATLSMTREVRDRTSKDLEGRQRAKGIKAFSASANALGTYGATDGHDLRSLFELYDDDSDVMVQVEFVPHESDADYKFQGEGIIITIDLNAPHDEDLTASISIEGGAMKIIDLPVV